MKIIFLCILYFFSTQPVAFSADAEKVVSSITGISTKLLSVEPVSRDSSCILTPQSLLKIRKNGDNAVLIDIRSNENFQKVRIPGSINIPLYALKTKDFLKSKLLVLINEGDGYQMLERECEKLKKLGFQSIYILYGGLNYWNDVDGSLEGDFFAIESISDIEPAGYFVDRNYDDWLVIDVSKSEGKMAGNIIPGRKTIPYSKNNEFFLSNIEKVISAHDNPLLKYILIVNEDGRGYGQLKQIIKNDKKIKNVFFLIGGLAEYKTFLQNQTAAGNQRKKTIKKCNTCP